MYLDVGVRRFHRFINLCLSEQKHHLQKKHRKWFPHCKPDLSLSNMAIVAVGWEGRMFEGQPIIAPEVVRVCVASRRIQA